MQHDTRHPSRTLRFEGTARLYITNVVLHRQLQERGGRAELPLLDRVRCTPARSHDAKSLNPLCFACHGCFAGEGRASRVCAVSQRRSGIRKWDLHFVECGPQSCLLVVYCTSTEQTEHPGGDNCASCFRKVS
jgi:hypothetical protein